MATLMPGEMGGMPTEYGMTQQQSNRKRKMAEYLRQQSESPQGQMVGGIYVAPAMTQYLSSALKGYQAHKMEQTADKDERDLQVGKNKAYADILTGNKPKQIEGQPTVTSTMPAYTPEQQDQFGSPLQGVQRQPVQTSTPTFTQESPQDMQARQQAAILQYVQQYGPTPEAQYMLAQIGKQDDRAYAKGEKLDDRAYQGTIRAEDRANKVFDINDQRRYEDIVRKDQQGFQVSQQDRQFAQQYQLQAQNQGFQAGQNSLNRNFQAGQNELSRDQQLVVAGLKGGANAPQAKINDAKDVISILNQAAPLVNKSTGSGIGNMIDESAQFLGTSTPGAQAAAQLKALEGSLVSKMPKMSGPQSDKDVLLYKQMAGQIGDPRIPAAQKQAAMNTINELNSRYAGVPVTPLNYGNPTMTPQQALGGLPQQGNVRTVDW